MQQNKIKQKQKSEKDKAKSVEKQSKNNHVKSYLNFEMKIKIY